jgi:hypothetical protein
LIDFVLLVIDIFRDTIGFAIKLAQIILQFLIPVIQATEAFKVIVIPEGGLLYLLFFDDIP